MKILWLTHCPTDTPSWIGSRHFHLLRHLEQKHEICRVSFNFARTSSHLLNLGRFDRQYQIRLLPPLRFFRRSGYPRPHQLMLNQYFYRLSIEKIIEKFKPNLMLLSSSHHFTGFPPFPAGLPCVFDYLDFTAPYVQNEFFRHAASIITVSPALQKLAMKSGKPTYLVTNGIDLNFYKNNDRQAQKQKLGLEEFFVVSLIGITCSPTFYFVDALADFQKKKSNLCFVLIGGGKDRDAILVRARKLGIHNIMSPGALPYEKAREYFLATDIGLYPGDDIEHFRFSCPIKILEYTASGAQIVSSPVDMFAEGWPNLWTTNPTRAGFANSLVKALETPRPCRTMAEFAWDNLSNQFESVLEDTKSLQESSQTRAVPTA